MVLTMTAELYRLAGNILLAGLYFKLRCEDPAEIVGCPTIEERDNSVDLRPGPPTAFSQNHLQMITWLGIK